VSTTIWVLQQGRVEAGDDLDHSLFFEFAEVLDAVSAAIPARKLSSFFDFADLEFNTSDEERPESWIEENSKWHDPDAGAKALAPVIARLKLGDVPEIPPDSRADLIAELEDCLAKVRRIGAANGTFHFCVVM
jgi:hypothetical protein